VSENKEDNKVRKARLVRDTWVMAATTIETRLWSARAFALRGRNAVQAVLFPSPSTPSPKSSRTAVFTPPTLL
jgi:hypothetical protein